MYCNICLLSLIVIYQFQDLDRLLFTYEAWANRVLPKSTFTEIIERLERVGSRREIQVALHRLRSGIWPPYVSAEHVHTSDSENDDHPAGSGDLVERADVTIDDEAAWERALQAIPVQGTAVRFCFPNSSVLTLSTCRLLIFLL